jgi:hypothetical protein
MYVHTSDWPIDNYHQVSLIVRDVVIMNKRIERKREREKNAMSAQ